MAPREHVPATLAAGLGLASLAAAMGIGRFAFTPIFPLMQQSQAVTLAEGAWLATANYVGYFVGACASHALAPDAGTSTRRGLLAVACSTLGMGLTGSLPLWLLLRFVAGVASAFVLVGASAWALAHLAFHGRSDKAGWVFAGVGIGISVAGCVALGAAASGWTPARVWMSLGGLALLVAVVAWRPLADAAPASQAEGTRAAAPLGRSAWLLVACYASFGLGYIVPATFIPAAARRLVDDPAVFGWAWPAFGLAAAVSTVGVTTLFRAAPPRRTAAWSLAVMAVGVGAPAIHPSLATLAVSALCVGGAFMVMTMAGVQEARRLAPEAPTRLISLLTAAFALGQLAGPLLVRLNASAEEPLRLPGAIAAGVLVCSALALSLTQETPMIAAESKPVGARLP